MTAGKTAFFESEVMDCGGEGAESQLERQMQALDFVSQPAKGIRGARLTPHQLESSPASPSLRF